MKKNITYILPLLGLFGCLSGIDLEAPTSEPILVVDGFIRDVDEEYLVRLSSTSNREGLRNEANVLGEGATIQLVAGDGRAAHFSEDRPGFYYLSADQMPAQVGQTYKLLIELANGSNYESRWAEMVEPIPIVDSWGQLFERRFLDNDGVEQTARGHDLYMTLENSTNSQYYVLDSESWAEVYIFYGDCQTVPPPGSQRCWYNRDPIAFNQLFLGSNQALEQNDYDIQPISIPLDVKGRYVALLRIDAMDSNSFEFWSEVKSQLDRPGGLFDPPFSTITTNIVPLNDAPPALGYFHAYSQTETIICLDRRELVFIGFIAGALCSERCIDVWSPGTYEEMADSLCTFFF